MSEALFMVITVICCSFLSIVPAFVELPFLLMLVVSVIPIVCLPLMCMKKRAKKD